MNIFSRYVQGYIRIYATREATRQRGGAGVANEITPSRRQWGWEDGAVAQEVDLKDGWEDQPANQTKQVTKCKALAAACQQSLNTGKKLRLKTD